MGRSPCCHDEGLKKGPWTPEEDQKLVDYIQANGHGSWRALPKHAGLNRCGKSCRLRWTNYLRPDIKRGKFTDEEERLIINLHSVLGNKWSAIATRLPGRTDNEIKNYWNTHLRKKLLHMGIDPVTHRPRPDLRLLAELPRLLQAAAASLGNLSSNPWDTLRLQADAAQVARIQMLQGLVQAIAAANSSPNVDLANLLGASMLGGGGGQPGDLLQPSSRHLQGLLESAAGLGHGTTPAPASSSGLPVDLGIPQIPANIQLLSQACLLPPGGRGLLHVPEAEDASSKLLGLESISSLCGSQTFSSGNDPASTSTSPPVGSPAPENISLEQFWEMIKCKDVISPNSSAVSFETWGALGDADNDFPWQAIDQASTFHGLDDLTPDGNLEARYGR